MTCKQKVSFLLYNYKPQQFAFTVMLNIKYEKYGANRGWPKLHLIYCFFFGFFLQNQTKKSFWLQDGYQMAIKVQNKKTTGCSEGASEWQPDTDVCRQRSWETKEQRVWWCCSSETLEDASDGGSWSPEVSLAVKESTKRIRLMECRKRIWMSAFRPVAPKGLTILLVRRPKAEEELESLGASIG